METITFNCELITPLFMSGADGTTPELRAPSIKGALRFWWRAMNGHLVIKNNKDEYDYTKLREKETSIFGGTFGEKAVKSKVFIRITNEKLKIANLPLPKSGITVGEFNNDIFKFMTFGMWGRKGEKDRNFIDVGSTFDIKMSYDIAIEKDLFSALYCLENFGAVGAKARNGFGCIKLNNNKINDFKIDISRYTIDAKDYSCFSKENKTIQTKSLRTWQLALREIQSKYINMKNSFSTKDKNLIAAHQPKSLSLERKAKFCHLNVSKVNGEYVGKILCLPYTFPNQEKHFTILKEFTKSIK